MIKKDRKGQKTTSFASSFFDESKFIENYFIGGNYGVRIKNHSDRDQTISF